MKCMGNWINRWHAYIGSKGAYFKGNTREKKLILLDLIKSNSQI